MGLYLKMIQGTVHTNMHVWPKRITQFQNQCGINLQKLQLSVTHHWEPPWLWLCTSQGITHITNTSSSTWSVEVAIHGKLSEGNPIGFRGAVLFPTLHRNAGSMSGCTLKSLKKGIKGAIQSKKNAKWTQTRSWKVWNVLKTAMKQKLVLINQDLKPWITCTWHKSDYFSALAYSS